MASLSIKAEGQPLQTLSDVDEIREYLGQYGIWYRRFEGADALGEDPTNAEVLAAYDEPVQALMKEGGYVTADVINITPAIANLQQMLDKFRREHWHSENEVRFIVHGRGLFHINPDGDDQPVFSIEVEKGDMINVPKGTHHWFDLCSEQNIRAIRLFQDPAGWTPHYTDSGEDEQHQPLCFGRNYIPRQNV